MTAQGSATVADNCEVCRQQLHAAQEAYAQLLEAYESVREVASAREISEVLEGVASAVGHTLPYVGSALFVRDTASGSLYASATHGFRKPFQKLLKSSLDTSLTEWVLHERRIALSPTKWEGRDLLTVWVPLAAGDEEIGALCLVVESHIAELTQQQQNILLLVGTEAAIAIRNFRLVERTKLQAEALWNVKSYLESILDSMPNGLVSTDEEGRIALFNRAASGLFDVDPDEAVGSLIEEILSPDVAYVFRRLLVSGLRGGKLESREIEVQLNHEKIPLRIVPSVLRGSDGAAIGMIFVVADLREEKELQELRRLDKLKDQFVATVSHELRTPITAIKSFSEILLQYDDPEARQEFLQIINRESDRLARMVNDILDLSKIEAGMMKWNIEEVEIDALVKQAIDSIRSLAMEKSVTIDWKGSGSGVKVVVDRERVVQVLLNLLSNAVKFSPENGHIWIGYDIIRGRRSTDTGDLVRVWVRDEGPGIPKEYQTLIFERFQQVTEDGGLTDRPKGTGLGLPIAKEIIEHLGGNIWVESEPGVGTTFYFTLPMAQKVREVGKAAAYHAQVKHETSEVHGIHDDQNNQSA